MGVTNRQEIDEAIAAVQKGKLSPAEMEYINIYGDMIRYGLNINQINPAQLFKLLRHPQT